ncbi:MAG TPA: SDR family NAD(P)-dependent oxidoreductase [Erythrobacter sp.]|nr:SDR family NAD(P)-dependent oxidoreductase [Erythrobacter sp.]
MSDVGKSGSARPRHAAVFGATGAIGAALCQALARGGVECIHAGSRSGQAPAHAAIRPFRFDLADEASIAAAAQAMREAPPELVIVASGVLTLEQGPGPEKSLRQIDPAAMAQVFARNTIGPALVAKHLLPLLPRDRWSVFAVLSARVGSISDNRLGGWHSYRASKAALNMLIRNFAIEQARTHPQSAVVGLHPGTVDSALSAPFQSNLPAGQLTAPDAAAAHLLEVMMRLRPEDSGKVFDWRGEEVPA